LRRAIGRTPPSSTDRTAFTQSDRRRRPARTGTSSRLLAGALVCLLQLPRVIERRA
jgi:hypothetical protein